MIAKEQLMIPSRLTISFVELRRIRECARHSFQPLNRRTTRLYDTLCKGQNTTYGHPDKFCSMLSKQSNLADTGLMQKRSRRSAAVTYEGMNG